MVRGRLRITHMNENEEQYESKPMPLAKLPAISGPDMTDWLSS